MNDVSINIGIIHTTINSIEPINEAFHEHAPDVHVLNFLDEGLMDKINSNNTITREMIRQLLSLVDRAEKSGADGILLACSAFSPYVADIKKFFDVPVLSADISMLEHAVQLAEHIGVIATVNAAGPTTAALLKEIARERNKNIEVYTEVIPEAFKALKNGNTTKHDELIRHKIFELSAYCDAIVLAQMSMSRAIKDFGQTPKPVLTSPEISVRSIMAQIEQIKIDR